MPDSGEKAASQKILVHVRPELADLVPMFLQTRRKEADTILAVLTAGDLQKIKVIGHNMAGTGGAYGFPEITTIGRALEQAALAADAEAVKACAASLSRYLSLVEVTQD